MIKSDEIDAGNRTAPGLPPPPADTPLLRGLKLLVIGLGVLLVLGFFTVIARMVYVASRPATQAASTPSGGALQSLKLPTGAVIRSTSVSGSRLAVHYEAPSGAAIAVFDLDTGRPVSRIRVESDPKLPW